MYTLRLSPEQLQAISAAIYELPFRVAAPLINHINAEVKASEEARSAVEVVEPEQSKAKK